MEFTTGPDLEGKSDAFLFGTKEEPALSRTPQTVFSQFHFSVSATD